MTKRGRVSRLVTGLAVIAIGLIVTSIAIPIYQKSIIRGKESMLMETLFTFRTVIDNYTYDKEKAPQTLQDLVTQGYLQDIPIDPMTGTNRSWEIAAKSGIFDVHSGSDKTGLNGKPYADW